MAMSPLAHAQRLEKLIADLNSDAEDDESLISSLHINEVNGLIDKKIISGGMIPKVRSCITALQGGVKKAHIIDGRIKHSLLLEIFTDQGIGTEIIL